MEHALPDRAVHGVSSVCSKGVGAMEVENFLLQQVNGVSQHVGGVARRRQDVVAATGLGVAGGAVDLQDGLAKQVQEWLLLLLRFAITRDPEDELAVLMMANGIDSLGRQWGRSAPTFFRRSSREVCKAIATLDDPKREAVLNRHLARINHPRLRRAFQAAAYPEARASEGPSRGKQPDLWTSLRR
jgi:hypothetical protein